MKFGWCTTGHHYACRAVIGGTTETLVCDCSCHADKIGDSAAHKGESDASVWDNKDGPSRGVSAPQPGPNHLSFSRTERG